MHLFNFTRGKLIISFIIIIIISGKKLGEVLRQPFRSKNFAADPVAKRTVLRLSESPTSAEKGSDACQKARFVHARVFVLAGPLV